MSTAPQVPEPRAPKRRRRWLLGLLVGLVCLMLGIEAFGRSDWLSDAVGREVAPLAREYLGLDAVLGRLEVHLADGELRLEGLALTHHAPDDPELHGAAVLSIEAAELELGLAGLRPTLKRVEIWRPFIHLHVGPDGVLELAGVTIEPQGNFDQLPWEELWLHDATVTVQHEQWKVGLQGLSAEPAGFETFDFTLDKLKVRVRDWSQTATDFRMLGVRLSPGLVRVPAFDLVTDDLRIRGGSTIEEGILDGEITVDVGLDGLAPLTQPGVILDGHATATLSLAGTTKTPDITGRLEVKDLLVDRLRPDGVRVDLWFGDLSSDLRLTNGLLTASPIEATWSGGQVELHAGVDLAHLGVSLSGRIRGVQLVDLLKNLSMAPTPWVALDIGLDLEAAGTLRPLRLAGSVDAVARRLRVASAPVEDPSSNLVLAIPEGRALAQVLLQGTALEVDIHRFTASQGVEAAVQIDAELTTPPSLDIRANIARFPLHVLQPLGGSDLQGIARGNARLWGRAGRFRAESDLEVDGMGVLGFHLADNVRGHLSSPEMKTLQFSSLDALLKDTHYTGSVDVALGQDPIGLGVDVVVHEGRLADLIGIVLEVPGLDGAVTGSAQLSGPWNRTNGDLNLQFADVDLFGEEFDLGGARATMDSGELVIDRMFLGRDFSDAGILARGRMGHGYTLDLDLHAGGLDLSDSAIVARSGVRLDGAVSADLHIAGTAFEPAPMGRVDLADFTIGRRRLGDVMVGFDTSGTLLSFEGTGFEGGVDVTGDLRLTGDANWNVVSKLDHFDLAPLLPDPANGGTTVAEVTGQFSASGLAGTPAEVDAELQEVVLAWDRHRLEAPEPWRVVASGGQFEVGSVTLEGGGTKMSLDARKDSDAQIHLESAGQIDLDLLRAIVPGMERSAGVASVAVEAHGRGADFAPTVFIEVSDGLFQGSWFPHAFEGVSGRIDASADSFVLRDVEGHLGGGDFTAGGTIEADNFVPTHFALSTEVQDARVRYLDFLPAGVGDASLTFDGPVDELLLSGNILIEDMTFAERIDWESWVLEFSGEHLSGAVAESAEDYFNLDIAVRSDETIRFRNNVGDFTVSADLQFLGNTSRPGLSGRVRAQSGGRVLLKERDFEINRAELRFTDPYSFDPDVDIEVQTEVSTREQDYNINYSVRGLYSDWGTSTRSEPALPQADINSLLLFGLTMEEMERYGGAVGALAVEGGDLLASKLGIVERVGQGVVGLDTVRPERIDLVSGVSERGSGTVSSDLRLLVEKDLDWATLIFEQNLSRSGDTYLGLERRLARLFYVRSYWAREQVGRRLDLGGAYGLEANVRGEID